jgi:RNA recognition motif-containing protein
MTNIYVGNISYQTTEDDLRSAFATFGNIERVNIVTDRDTGQPRGFAFVEMTERESAEKAIAQLNGTDLQGRAITVNEARPKPSRGSGYGDRGGSGGGRSRGARW